MKKLSTLLLALFILTCTHTTPPIIDRLQPVPHKAGFRMPGYFVWGGSLVQFGDEYHLFASRWPTWQTLGIAKPQNKSMLSGYRDHSEIVHAVADDPLGPFTFKDVVVSGRGGHYWDGQMCHNPKIVKIDEKYVLFYIGRSTSAPQRKIGYAWAEHIDGPWHRSEQEILLTDDANNPAPFVSSNGEVLLAFRDRELVNYIARADSFNGAYEIVARDITPGIKHEDPSLFFMNDEFHMITEDNVGEFTGHVRHGAHLVSKDGLAWQPFDPVHAYTHTIVWTNGDSTIFTRRERPELLNLKNPPELKYTGQPTHLVTGCLLEEQSWCIIQAIGAAR